MGVGEDFSTFCGNLVVSNRDVIAVRYGAITKRLNLDFWNSDSETAHSFYTGSYGRGTAIGGTSDVDMLFTLPSSVYTTYNSYTSNGQSALLQAVRTSIRKTYSSTDVGGDGQVVVVTFSDGVRFEVLPAFENTAGTYTFPDSNSGGSWRTTNPKPEFAAIKKIDDDTNGNLKRLCKMARAWRREWSLNMSGLLIDTLAYYFIRDWQYRDKAFLYYDWMSRDFFAYLKEQDEKKTYWLSPGANQWVWLGDKFQYKATRCYNISLEAIDYASKGYTTSARGKWRDIYGTSYPS